MWLSPGIELTIKTLQQKTSVAAIKVKWSPSSCEKKEHKRKRKKREATREGKEDTERRKWWKRKLEQE